MNQGQPKSWVRAECAGLRTFATNSDLAAPPLPSKPPPFRWGRDGKLPCECWLILSRVLCTLFVTRMAENLRPRTAADARLGPPDGLVSGAPDGTPVAPESDAMVLAREAAKGNSVATGRLLRLLAPRLGGVVRAIMGAQHPDLEDALQLTLIG